MLQLVGKGRCLVFEPPIWNVMFGELFLLLLIHPVDIVASIYDECVWFVCCTDGPISHIHIEHMNAPYTRHH